MQKTYAATFENEPTYPESASSEKINPFKAHDRSEIQIRNNA